MLTKAQDFLRSRKQSYRAVFKGVQGERVLSDLAKFCRANKSTFHTDQRIEGALQGRREVFLRIQQHLNLTEDELFTLYQPTGE